MNFDITGINGFTMINRDTKEEFDFGEIETMEIEQDEFCADEEVSRRLKCFGTLSFETSTDINQEALNKMIGEHTVDNAEFKAEWETKILTNARWHKKSRIRKKWQKRYGYKEDTIKMTAKCRTGEYNKETGESNFDIEELSYILRSDQLRRGLTIIGV